MKKLTVIIWSIIIVAIIIGLIFIFLWFRGNESQRVDVAVSLPDNVFPGLPFIAKFRITNNSDSPLNTAKLNINLDENLAFVGFAKEKLVLNEELGSIPPNSTIEKEHELIAYGEINILKVIAGQLEYSFGAVQGRIFKKFKA